MIDRLVSKVLKVKLAKGIAEAENHGV